MTADGARKIRRFVETCDTFHLPIVSFVDEPGFMIGPEAERAGTIRFGMEALFAVQQTRVPWLAVVLRKSFGVAQGIHMGRAARCWRGRRCRAARCRSKAACARIRSRDRRGSRSRDRRAELEEEMARRSRCFRAPRSSACTS